MAQLSSSNHGMNILQGFKNKIINGNFDIWQRQTSQTSIGYGSDDRFRNDQSGSTKTHSRQSFTLGQTDVPGEPKYFSRTVVTSSAGASSYVNKVHRIESVRTFAGRKATLSFWAKADATKDIAVEFAQVFGSGGTPSTAILGIDVATVGLTTSWQKIIVNVDVPSISGKTLGTDNNDHFDIVFWFEAGSAYDSRTNSLGQQSGTFDLAQIQLEEGNKATEFEDRPIATELILCQRYFEKSHNLDGFGDVNNTESRYNGSATTTNFLLIIIFYKVNKRDLASLTFYNDTGGTAGTWDYYNGSWQLNKTPGLVANARTTNYFGVSITDIGAFTTFNTYNTRGHWYADAEI